MIDLIERLLENHWIDDLGLFIPRMRLMSDLTLSLLLPPQASSDPSDSVCTAWSWFLCTCAFIDVPFLVAINRSYISVQRRDHHLITARITDYRDCCPCSIRRDGHDWWRPAECFSPCCACATGYIWQQRDLQQCEGHSRQVWVVTTDEGMCF